MYAATLSGVLELLRSPAFHLLGVPVSWAEILGDISGVLCVWWVARQNILSWPVGIANNLFFLILFWTAKLYGDAVLQIIFAALGFYGWWSWLFGGAKGEKKPLPVRKVTKQEAYILGLGSIAGTIGVERYLALNTDSPVPLPDAAVLVLSLAATYGQAKKILESWWVWIFVDVISVPLYIARGLYPTALLYVIFGVLCVIGLKDWNESAARVHLR